MVLPLFEMEKSPLDLQIPVKYLLILIFFSPSCSIKLISAKCSAIFIFNTVVTTM